jgi:hypothetical protein
VIGKGRKGRKGREDEEGEEGEERRGEERRKNGWEKGGKKVF